MIKLIRNAEVYAPEYLGRKDILIAGEKIAAVGDRIEGFGDSPFVEVFDAEGRTLVPGYIDVHEHISGLGGMRDRHPELPMSLLLKSGVTTVLGLLGGDAIFENINDLLAKVRSLNNDGMTAYMVCGSYQYPSATVTGSVATDIAYIPEIIGVKVAISDSRSSNISREDFIKLASEAKVGGMVSGKAGMTVMHTGPGKDRLDRIIYAIENSELPVEQFLPGHCTRSPELTAAAAEFAKKYNGTFDITCGFTRPWSTVTAKKIVSLKADGVPMTNMTISTDANAPQLPKDCFGNVVTEKVLSPINLHNVIRSLVQIEKMDLSEALLLVTSNPARMMKLQGKKGAVVQGADADLIIYGTEDMEIETVFARGKLAVDKGEALMAGKFE